MISNRNTPRLLGAAFLFVAFASLVGGLILMSLNFELTGSPENISETMTSFSDDSRMVQLSIIVFLIEAVAMVLLAVLLVSTLKKQNKIIARWGFGLWIIQAAFVALRQVIAFSFLHVSQEFVNVGTSDSSNHQTLGNLFYELMQFGSDAQMVFYTTGGMLFYYLLFKSKYIPQALALFGVVVASVGFVGEILVLFGNDVPLYVFLPILPFEIAIGVWLVVKGFNSEPNKT